MTPASEVQNHEQTRFYGCEVRPNNILASVYSLFVADLIIVQAPPI